MKLFATVLMMLLIFGSVSGCRTLARLSNAVDERKKPNHFYVKDDRLHFVGTMVSQTDGSLGLYKLKKRNRALAGYSGRTVRAARWRRFAIDYRPISSTTRKRGVRLTSFKLPSRVSDPDACYVIVNEGFAVKHVSLYDHEFSSSKPEQYYFSLAPYYRQKAKRN